MGKLYELITVSPEKLIRQLQEFIWGRNLQDGVVDTKSMKTETVDETVMEDMNMLKDEDHYDPEAEVLIEDPVHEAMETILNGIDDK